MSSRALRRAQKELEEKRQLEILAQEEEGEDDSEEEVAPASKAKPSLFAMLGDAGGDASDEDEVFVEVEPPDAEDDEEVAPAPKASKKAKKKRKKGKSKARDGPADNAASANKADMDDIDRALEALNLTSRTESGPHSEETAGISEELQQLYSVLSIDDQHLKASNEMKKLFGRAALRDEEEDQPRPRQGRRGQQVQGLAAAVAGRNAPGRGLASLGLRRNIFIQGKEEWPKATSAGLGMEVVEKRGDGTVQYRFVHNSAYQGVQKQFETCVASMDPERMVQLLHFNPYHISTLLQVSEIAKQQRDNATSGELLERALFTFGRAVHSTFANNLFQGKARLDFRRPENREFWLAAWRYIITLGVRATWRTAFEWGKLLVTLSPEEDPYCMRLLIDQLALRGREPRALVDIVEAEKLERAWKIPPNLAFSVALAYDRLKNPTKARSSLREAIKQYPWIASRLCKELEIDPIPKSVWGKEPNGDTQELLCQLYVPKAKDLWNTPEAISLLGEVAYSFDQPLGAGEDPYWLRNIHDMDLARHVILSDDRTLLSLLDQRIKSKYTSVSDPLPPDDSISSYSTADTGDSRTPNLNETQLLTELERMRIYFEQIDLGRNIEPGVTPEDLIRILGDAGTSIHEFRRNSERVQVLRAQLQNLGVQVVFEDAEDGEEVDSEGDE